MERLEPLARELGLENRIFILNKLNEGGKTVAQIRKDLKTAGISKPFSTVGRYVKSLREVHLVCEVGDEYHLTLKGRIVLGSLSELNQVLTGFEKVEEVVSEYPISYLPDDLLPGVWVIGLTEIVNDTFNVMWDTITAVKSAEREVLVLNTDIINRDFGELAVKKCLQGMRLSAVVYPFTVKERTNMLYDIIEKHEISGKDLDTLKKNFIVRSYSGRAPNLIIADMKGAGISLPNPESTNSLTPAFKSDKTEFIDWVKGIFTWYWERGEPVNW